MPSWDKFEEAAFFNMAQHKVKFTITKNLMTDLTTEKYYGYFLSKPALIMSAALLMTLIIERTPNYFFKNIGTRGIICEFIYE